MKKKGKTYWQEIKKLSKYKSKFSNNKIIEENGLKYETASDKANIFALHYEKTYKKCTDNNF